MKFLQKNKITSSADVIEKHLILSLPNATEPVVWRMALDKIGTASFEIKKPTKTIKEYRLTLKPKKGAAENIAAFETEDAAFNALLQASAALQKKETAGQSQTNTIEKEQNTQKNKSGSKWFYLFLGFIAVIALYAYMTSLIPQTQNLLNESAQTNSTSASGGTNNQAGVPLSADDFLNGR